MFFLLVFMLAFIHPTIVGWVCIPLRGFFEIHGDRLLNGGCLVKPHYSTFAQEGKLFFVLRGCAAFFFYDSTLSFLFDLC